MNIRKSREIDYAIMVKTDNKKRLLHRGYSAFLSCDHAHIQGASCDSNVIIKSILPSRGVVSSNAARVDRLLQHAKEIQLLTEIQEHTNSGWGIKIHTAIYMNYLEVFIASIPMGSAGAGFAIFEMFAAGAQAVSSVCYSTRLYFNEKPYFNSYTAAMIQKDHSIWQ